MADRYYEGVGRRKNATARVRFYEGKGTSVINDKPASEYFRNEDEYNMLLEPLKVIGYEGDFYITVKTSGGGFTGQIGSIILGLSRALVKLNEENKPALRKAGMMTRDPRMVERKKYNFRKARRKPQFSKR